MDCRDFSKSSLGFRSGSKSNLLLHQGWEKMLQPVCAGVYKWEKGVKDLEATSKNAEVSETSGTSYSWRSKVQQRAYSNHHLPAQHNPGGGKHMETRLS